MNLPFDVRLFVRHSASSRDTRRYAQSAVLLCVLCGAIGCFDLRAIGERRAMNQIADHMEGRNEPLKRRLNVCVNVDGQGFLVFVRSTAHCGPQYLWLADGELGVYAVDGETQSITPGLPLLERAGPDARKRIGFTIVTAAIREAVCRTKDR